MTSWVQKALAALIALTALSAGSIAAAQPSLQDFLTQQLDRQEPRNADDGYAHAVGPLAGSLPSPRAAQLPLTLRVGQEIRVAGVCDQNCADLDLRVFDPRGRIVAMDTGDDDSPVVDMQAEMYGQHTIEVDMIDCAASRCRYAVNVYTR
jgi:hypothetical protein